MINKLLSKLISVCTVSSVNYEKSTLRVEIGERGVVSGELQVLQRRAQGNKDFDMPEEGEEVLCLFLPQDNFISGFVIGSSYNNEDTQFNGDGKKGIKSYRWKDGSFIKYDESTKKMEIGSVGDIVVTSGNLVTINAKNLDVNVEENITFSAGGDLDVLAGGGFGVSASESNFDNIINAPDIITDVGSYNKHPHTGNSGVPTSTPYK